MLRVGSSSNRSTCCTPNTDISSIVETNTDSSDRRSQELLNSINNVINSISTNNKLMIDNQQNSPDPVSTSSSYSENSSSFSPSSSINLTIKPEKINDKPNHLSESMDIVNNSDLYTVTNNLTNESRLSFGISRLLSSNNQQQQKKSSFSFDLNTSLINNSINSKLNNQVQSTKTTHNNFLNKKRLSIQLNKDSENENDENRKSLKNKIKSLNKKRSLIKSKSNDEKDNLDSELSDNSNCSSIQIKNENTIISNDEDSFNDQQNKMDYLIESKLQTEKLKLDLHNQQNDLFNQKESANKKNSFQTNLQPINRSYLLNKQSPTNLLNSSICNQQSPNSPFPSNFQNKLELKPSINLNLHSQSNHYHNLFSNGGLGDEDNPRKKHRRNRYVFKI